LQHHRVEGLLRQVRRRLGRWRLVLPLARLCRSQGRRHHPSVEAPARLEDHPREEDHRRADKEGRLGRSGPEGVRRRRVRLAPAEDRHRRDRLGPEEVRRRRARSGAVEDRRPPGRLDPAGGLRREDQVAGAEEEVECPRGLVEAEAVAAGPLVRRRSPAPESTPTPRDVGRACSRLHTSERRSKPTTRSGARLTISVSGSAYFTTVTAKVRSLETYGPQPSRWTLLWSPPTRTTTRLARTGWIIYYEPMTGWRSGCRGLAPKSTTCRPVTKTFFGFSKLGRRRVTPTFYPHGECRMPVTLQSKSFRRRSATIAGRVVSPGAARVVEVEEALVVQREGAPQPELRPRDVARAADVTRPRMRRRRRRTAEAGAVTRRGARPRRGDLLAAGRSI